MAKLDVLLLKQLCNGFDSILKVSCTSDTKLLSALDKNNVLRILSTKCASNSLSLSNLSSFAWQEDNYYLNEYRLLAVDKYSNICYYIIKDKSSSNSECLLDAKCVSKWDLKQTLQQFHDLAKQLSEVSQYEILKFEAKEAVFLIDKKLVASFFLSAAANPHIMSISHLCEKENSCNKVILMKETLFVLDANKTKLSLFSFSNNTKLHEIDLSECNFKNSETVENFCVNLKMDKVVFVSSSKRLYSMLLDVTRDNTGQSPSVVTAFTKQFPSVRGIDDSLRRYSMSSQAVQPVFLSCNTSNMELKELFLLENKLFFIYWGNNESVVGIHLLDSDEATAYKVFPHTVFFLSTGSKEVTFPLLLFYNKEISLVLYNIEQDKLVNELMIYPSSGAVESLASLNNWNSIQMDIEVLRLGLSNRKIYTVEFYLKTLFEGFSQQWKANSNSKWLDKIRKECSNWENIFHILIENICDNLFESTTCHYAEQLLQIVVVMVIQVLDVIQNRETDKLFSSHEQSLYLSKFCELLLQMRKLLRRPEMSTVQPSDCQHLPSKLNAKVSDYWKKWGNLPPEDIIQESILTGTIPLAQSFFYNCNDTFNSSFQQFEIAAQNLVTCFFRQGSISEALKVMRHMGDNINMKLTELFKTTPEKDIRFLIKKELEKRNLLSDSDLFHLDFITLLENLYPCSSFEHARLLLEEQNLATVNEINCASPYSVDKLDVGDFMIFNQDNSESGAYCRIVLNWIDMWDDDIKSRILAPHILRNSPVLEYFSKGVNFEINFSSLWHYLLETGSYQYLNSWIDSWLESDNTSVSASIFKNWPMNDMMISSIPERAPSYISDMLLNKLAQHGIFCEEELEDISLFLARIGRSQCNIHDVSIFTSDKSSLTFSDLMHRLVHYCLKHDLVHFLYSLFIHNYEKFSTVLCVFCDVPLFNLTKAFYLWSQNENDSQLVFDAMAKAAQFIYGLKSCSSSDLLQGLPLPLCLSILLFKSQPLTEIIKEALTSTEDMEQILIEQFKPYPLLQNYILQRQSEHHQPDVTVYELLKDSTKFDTSQLFGWQPSNTFKSEDSMNDLPHFSLKSLSEQYGLKKELNYLYYLMQGRPNYAYLKFIQQEVVLETGLSVARIKSAYRDVIDYSLANYRSSEISMACVLFIELIGQDSLPLRSCLIAANLLHDYRVRNNQTESGESLSDICKLFKLAYLSKESAADLVLELEKLTVINWDPYCVDSNSLVKDICEWMPVMTISNLFGVEAGNMYLYECAKQNKWFKFLVFSQIFQLPKDQVLKAASRFSNFCLYYHIFHALQKTSLQEASHDVKVSPSNNPPTKDTRKSYISRLMRERPVAARKENEDKDDLVSISSEISTTSSLETDSRPLILKDLFGQLLLAHNSDVPWESLLHTSFEIQNPVLSVFAASYPECSLQSCYFMWLYTTLCQDDCTKKQVENRCIPNRISSVSTDDVESLILVAIQNRKFLILWQSVQFFLPTTPLVSLLEFLKDFLVYKKFESSIESFQNHLWDYPRNSDHSSILYSALWLENISVSILKEAVISCSTSYERLILLRHFSHTRLEKSFSKEVIVPPFMKVYHMLQYTGDTSHDIDVEKLFLPENDIEYQSVCWILVNELLQKHEFYDAEMLATAAKLPLEDFFLLQIQQTVDEARDNESWSKLSYRIDFWKSVFDKLTSTIIPIEIAINFFETQCEVSDMYGEKYFLMKFIIHLLSMNDSKSPSKDLTSLQKKMWLWCVKAEVKNELSPEIFDSIPTYEFNTQDIDFDIKNGSFVIEDDMEKEALCCIINKFLSKKDLKKAFELASTFDYNSQDLEIIQMCFKIVKNEVDVSSVNFPVKDFNIGVPSSRFIKSLLLWFTSSSVGSTFNNKDKIQCIEALSKKTEAATTICHQILVQYITATVLNKKYEEITGEKDSLSILKQILTKKLNDDYILAKCFIIVQDLPDRDIAVFLSEEIWHSLQVLTLFNLVLLPEEQLAYSEELIYDPLRTTESFQLIVKLCQDPSILGNILMDKYSKETTDLSAKTSDKAFSSAVELCICAHECFTAACCMDGISQVLHTSQHLVNVLEEAKKFSIMVRLLTGLGRYCEMIWVFDVLKSHDKLSLLFVKKMENEPNLRLALLDYLKRLPPSEADKYFYSLAKTFGMYREKAEILEMSVQKQLSQLCKKNLDIGMKEDLEDAMQCLSQAAKSYCKADCFHQAQSCTQLAQLVALQIYFLPSGIWIIGLDDVSVTRFITEHDNFPQAFIVAEQYGKHQLWNQAVLNNVVCRGDKKYLNDFQAQFGMSTSLISDVSRRYEKISPKTDSIVKNMKYLLSFCHNIKVKYSLAKELCYTDMASELLTGDGAPYLQDLIANNILK